ncbi:type II secretion system protein [Motilimonas pumila]|uniref:Type II secretion system protein n=1 Tax=Motilimonas pumila TaxID=2303987 RepID=A0A418YHX1_9GAMM|nr:type II secretion system protein [Motilimonas pumila]RJG49980.1 type II secretion system protein [Motilimonas pumila]
MPIYQQKVNSSKLTGFTLVELVIVIILLGILAAYALPKLLSSSGFEDYAVRDQLITRLRLTQLQNMNADPSNNATSNACYWTVIKQDAPNSCIYSYETARLANGGSQCSAPDTGLSCSASAPEHQSDPYGLITFANKVSITTGNFLFDFHGRETQACATFPCQIDIDSGNSLSVEIEQEGYIHAN